VTGLLIFPVISSDLCSVEDIFKSSNHLSLKIAKVELYDALESKVRIERYNLLILGIHGNGSPVRSWAFLQEFNVFKTVEAIADVLVDLLWVVTVRKNVQQGLIRNEIEASEDLLLSLEIIVKSLLASFDFTVESVEQFLTAISSASGDDSRFFFSFTHQFFPFIVHLLETFGVFGELGTDIIGADEDGFETLPVPLYFSPDGNCIINSL